MIFFLYLLRKQNDKKKTAKFFGIFFVNWLKRRQESARKKMKSSVKPNKDEAFKKVDVQKYGTKMLNIFLLMNKILGVYALIITVFGTLLNLFSFFICLRIKRNTTFVFMASFSLANAFCLYWWNLNNFLKEFVNVDLLAISVWVCRIGNFVQFTSLEISAWHLVSFLLSFQINFENFVL